MTDLENIEFESFDVDPPEIEITRHAQDFAKTIRLFGNIKKGRLRGIKLLIDLKKSGEDSDTLTASYDKKTGDFSCQYPANQETVGEYTAIARFPADTSYEVKSDTKSFKIILNQS